MKLLAITRCCAAVVVILTSLTNSLSAQKHLDINLAHNWNFFDRDFEISLEHFPGKFGVKAGLNIFQHTAQESLNWERPYAANFGQKIGYHAALLYRAPVPNSNVELSPFFKIASFYLSQKQQIGENNAVVSNPYLRTATSLGVQAKARLSGRLMLFGNVEAGSVWEFGTYPNQLSGNSIYFNGLATGGSIGLGWRLKR